MIRRNVTKAARGRFASALPAQKEEEILSLIKNPALSLPEIAHKTGVSLETVLRRKGERVSMSGAQQQYFQILKKEYVLPVVREMALNMQIVSTAGVLRVLSKTHHGQFSKTLVSRAIDQLAAEGLKFERPREYHEALLLAEKKRAEWKEVDELIVQFRKKAPELRDQQLVDAINGILINKKISYNTLRKRITFLKKRKLLSSARRGYSV